MLNVGRGGVGRVGDGGKLSKFTVGRKTIKLLMGSAGGSSSLWVAMSQRPVDCWVVSTQCPNREIILYLGACMLRGAVEMSQL